MLHPRFGVIFNMILNIHGQNNFKVHESSELKIYSSLEDYLLIDDIRNDQASTIGELHYDPIATGPTIRTIFTTNNGDKVVRNEILNSSNRINYNLGYIPSEFTAIFDYKAGGGNGADGAYFYFHAQGTQNPNEGQECSYYDNDNEENIIYACDSFPNGKYNNSDADAYRIHFDEYSQNQQLAVSWAGYEGGDPQNRELIGSIGAVSNYPAGFDFADGTWRKIKIKFDNGSFKILVDNNLLLQTQDNSYSSRNKIGTNFGLGGYIGGLNNYHYFKNFKLYNILF